MSVTVGKVRVYKPWLTAGETRSNDFTKCLSGRAPCAAVSLSLSLSLSPPSLPRVLSHSLFPSARTIMPAHYPRTCVASTCGRATSRAYFLAENARCFDLSRVAATRTSLVPSLPFSLASRGEMCPVRRSDRRAALLLHSAVGRWRKREREREKGEEERERPAKNH